MYNIYLCEDKRNIKNILCFTYYVFYTKKDFADANLPLEFSFRRKTERKMEWKMVEIVYTDLDRYPPGVFYYVIFYFSLGFDLNMVSKISTL